MKQSSNFFSGFEKRAIAQSTKGVSRGLLSGKKNYDTYGKLKAPTSLGPNTSIAPRSDLPELATFQRNSSNKNLESVITPKGWR